MTITKVHACSQGLWELSLGSVRPMLFGASLKVSGMAHDAPLAAPKHVP